MSPTMGCLLRTFYNIIGFIVAIQWVFIRIDEPECINIKQYCVGIGKFLDKMDYFITIYVTFRGGPIICNLAMDQLMIWLVGQ